MALKKIVKTNTDNLAALEAKCVELAKSHGLREDWAEAVYYGKMTVDEAVIAQEENDKQFCALMESVDSDLTADWIVV